MRTFHSARPRNETAILKFSHLLRPAEPSPLSRSRLHLPSAGVRNLIPGGPALPASRRRRGRAWASLKSGWDSGGPGGPVSEKSTVSGGFWWLNERERINNSPFGIFSSSRLGAVQPLKRPDARVESDHNSFVACPVTSWGLRRLWVPPGPVGGAHLEISQ